MRLADLHAKPLPHKRKKRIGRGRGSGWGCTAGRGNKGAGSRAGAGGRQYHEGGQTPLYRRFPKRGFSNAPFHTPCEIVNVADLNRFEAGTEVGLEQLREARLIRRRSARVKVLGRGRIDVALKISAHGFTESAARKIQAAGGEIRTI